MLELIEDLFDHLKLLIVLVLIGIGATWYFDLHPIAYVLVLLAGIWAVFSGFFTGALVGASGIFGGALLFGTFGFWVLVVVMSLVIWYSISEIENEKKSRCKGGGWAITAYLGVALLLQFCGDIKVFTYAWGHPVWAFIYLIAFVFIGVAYSCSRWARFLKQKSLEFAQRKAEFFTTYKITENTIPSKREYEWKTFLRSHPQPQAKGHSFRIIHWIAYWPWSLVWFLLHDYFRKFFQHVYETFEWVFDGISNYMWKDIRTELEGVTVEQPKPPSKAPTDDGANYGLHGN